MPPRGLAFVAALFNRETNLAGGGSASFILGSIPTNLQPVDRGYDDPVRRLTPLLALVLICVIFWLWFTQVDGSTWQLHHTIGVVITVPSWLLWARSRYDLGASFTGRAEARTLVTRGIYSKIRHPIYLFGECLCVGLFVFIGQPLLWLVFVVTIPMQLIRARKEQRVLEAAFGEEYRAYQKQVWF